MLVAYACIFPQEIARITTFQLFRLEFGVLWLRVTCVARVWPFGLVLGVRVSNMVRVRVIFFFYRFKGL